MNFERHLEPKDSMNVGLKAKAIEIYSCAVKFKIDKEEEENTKSIDVDDIESLLDMWQEDFFASRKMIKMLHLRGFWKRLTTIRVLEIHFRIKIDPNDNGEFPCIGGDRIGIVRGTGDKSLITWQKKFYELKGASHYKYFIM